MMFARYRATDLTTIMTSGCLGPTDPYDLSLVRSNGTWLLGMHGWSSPSVGPYDFDVYRADDGGAHLVHTVSLHPTEYIKRQENGGGPIFVSTRLVERRHGGALALYTDELVTHAILLRADGTPAAKTIELSASAPYVGGAVAVDGAVLVLRYRAFAGYSDLDPSSAFITRITDDGTASDVSLPLDSGTATLVDGEVNPAVMIQTNERTEIAPLSSDGQLAHAFVDVAIPRLTFIASAYAFKAETWILAADRVSRTPSPMLLFRIDDRGALVESRALSDATAANNLDGFVGLAGGKPALAWTDPRGYLVRRIVLTELEPPVAIPHRAE